MKNNNKLLLNSLFHDIHDYFSSQSTTCMHSYHSITIMNIFHIILYLTLIKENINKVLCLFIVEKNDYCHLSCLLSALLFICIVS